MSRFHAVELLFWGLLVSDHVTPRTVPVIPRRVTLRRVNSQRHEMNGRESGLGSLRLEESSKPAKYKVELNADALPRSRCLFYFLPPLVSSALVALVCVGETQRDTRAPLIFTP